MLHMLITNVPRGVHYVTQQANEKDRACHCCEVHVCVRGCGERFALTRL